MNNEYLMCLNRKSALLFKVRNKHFSNLNTMKSIIHVMIWNHHLGPLTFRLQLYVTHLKILLSAHTSPYTGEKTDTSQEWKPCDIQKRLWLSRSNREQQVQATSDLHTDRDTHTLSHTYTQLYIHPAAHTLHPPLLDVAVTRCNSGPGWLPWVLVSRLNGLPQQASKTPRVERVKSGGGRERGGVKKKSWRSRDKHEGEEVIV